MKNTDDILSTFKTYLETNLPAALTAAGASSIDAYELDPPTDPDVRTVAIYPGDGIRQVDFSTETFIIQVQLPGELTPRAHHKAVQKVIQAFPVNTVRANSVELNFSMYYPGEVIDGGGGCFIIYQVTLLDTLDDCADDSNF